MPRFGFTGLSSAWPQALLLDSLTGALYAVFCKGSREMTMLRLTRSQRMMLADKVLDVANVAAGALVVGQLLGDQFSIALAIAGIGAWIVLAICALAVAGRREQ